MKLMVRRCSKVLGRVKIGKAQRERLLDEFERSGLNGIKFAAVASVTTKRLPHGCKSAGGSWVLMLRFSLWMNRRRLNALRFVR